LKTIVHDYERSIMGNKENKQFPLDSRENCCIYLCRIISSCELCMDKLKKYNEQAKTILKLYEDKDVIPYDFYSEMCDKTYSAIDYILNLLGDCQDSSISYFKYRKTIEKRINRGNFDITLLKINDEISDIMLELNKMRNWQNHVPESLLVSEIEMVHNGKMELPMDPVKITHYTKVEHAYYKHLYCSNILFYNNSRKIIQVAKKEYSLLMGKSVEYPRVYTNTPLGFAKSEPAKQSAKIQGLKCEE